MGVGLGLGQSMKLRVRGDCMRSIEDGAFVLVRRQALYAPGDVVVVRRRDHWNAHRFLGYAPSRHGIVALTRADASASADPAAPHSSLVGRVDVSVSRADRVGAIRAYVGAILERIGGRRR